MQGKENREWLSGCGLTLFKAITDLIDPAEAGKLRGSAISNLIEDYFRMMYREGHQAGYYEKER